MEKLNQTIKREIEAEKKASKRNKIIAVIIGLVILYVACSLVTGSWLILGEL